MINIAKPVLGEEEVRAVSEILLSGKLAQGEKVAEFEKGFAGFVGAKHAVAVGNGTQALHLAMLACGVKSKDEVITTGFSFIASATTILHCGAKPVFADIDKKTFNIDLAHVKKLITKKTKAIVPVHLFGLPAAIAELRELCDSKGMALVEDACQAHGASVNGKRVGTFGETSAFSFYPTKNMTTGEGGAITTNDDAIAEKLRLLRHQGQKSRYEYACIGYNYRMTEFAAAIGICQLKKLPAWTETRINNAEYLNKELAGTKAVTPFVPSGYKHVYHQYTLRVKNRDEVMKKLADMGVGSGVYYPMGLHQLGPLTQYAKGKLPEVERAAKEVLSLPVHPSLSQEDLKIIAGAVKRAVSS
jgi:perosamine synthetase